MELDAVRQSIFDGNSRRMVGVYKGGDRVSHKEHEANLHAQSSGCMQVPDFARRVFQAQCKK